MGFALHRNKKREVDSEKHLKRMHKTTPFIESPLTGADLQNLVFSQRHEASSAELFYDLFFVANLATFTAYHSVTDSSYLIAYVGFFGILWSTWFQTVLHDVRFARDSIYERVCKTVQFITFVGLALVGSAFNPGGHKGNNTNFRILCYTLVISRGILVLQYCVVLFYTFRARYSKLYLPLGLMIGIYALATATFGALTPAFREQAKRHEHLYLVWYAVMVVEGALVIAISCFWRMLSFKKTHLMERMSLLTLIVIGEGAIGVTKTVSRIMGKTGLEVEGCFLIMCVIMVLVLLWAFYFDNFPHGHYGTIRQQIWSILHFPFQLAIVGIVEGSQQVALARYVMKNYIKIDDSVYDYCYTQNLDGTKLRDKMLYLLDYWQFDKKLETKGFNSEVSKLIYKVGNSTGICSKANATSYIDEGFPEEFYNITMKMFDGVYQGLGMKIPSDKLQMYTASEIAVSSWKVVYLYYWVSFCLLIACSIAFLFLIRRHKLDVFDIVSVATRTIALIVGGALIGLIAKEDWLYSYISSPAVLPTCLALLFTILVFDKLSALWSNWRLKKSGEPFATEEDEEHHHEGGHGEVVEHDPHREPLTTADAKTARWSSYSDSEPLTRSTAYQPHHGYAMESLSPPLLSPPIMSPPMTSPDPAAPGQIAGGYAPLAPQHYGA